jgi:hypothetical protein
MYKPFCRECFNEEEMFKEISKMKNEAKEMTESSNDTSEASSPSKDQE